MKSAIKNFVILSFVSLFFITSCKENKKKVKPISKGEPGRLVLVSTDQLFNELEETIDEVFLEPQPWLAQAEAFFKLSKLDPKTFRRSFMEHQSILFLVTKENRAELNAYIPKINEQKIEEFFSNPNSMPILAKNKWASPQNIYFLLAPDKQSMEEKLLKFSDQIQRSIYEAETKNYALRLFNQKDTLNPKYKQIKNKLGMGLAITEKFDLMKFENDFFWFAERYTNEQLGVLCYKIPYTDTIQFTKEYLFDLRDSVLKQHIPGEREGSYMTTSSSDSYPRFYESIELNGMYAKKLRGWWTVHGEFMGGPFVMYAVLNKEGTEIFIYEGFIYAPNKSKSKNLRTLESFAQTIR